MIQFEIWYAIEKDGQYFGFTKNLKEAVANGFLSSVVELAVFIASKTDKMPFPYLGMVEGDRVVSIVHHKVAEHLYDDTTKLSFLIVQPIIRCEKCRIMYVDNVFYWDYVSETRGRQAATPEQVLAKVCIPTARHGDRQHISCLAKQLYESDLGLLQKSPAELQDFVRANNNQVEMDLPDEKYYLDMAREILDEQN